VLIFCAAPLWRGHLIRHTSYNSVYHSKDFWRGLWRLHQFSEFLDLPCDCKSLLVLFCSAKWEAPPAVGALQFAPLSAHVFCLLMEHFFCT